MPKQKKLKEQGVTKDMVNKLISFSNKNKSVVIVNVKKSKKA